MAARMFEPAPALKPRPKLLAVFSVVLTVWVGFLVFLYFRTPRPVHAVPHGNGRAVEAVAE